MSLFNAEERAFAAAVSKLAHCNPFTRATGGSPVNSLQSLIARAESLARACRARLDHDACAPDAEVRLYEDVALFLLYHRYDEPMMALIEPPPDQRPRRAGDLYARFASDAAQFLEAPGVRTLEREPASHLFACFFQIRRAFHHIASQIVGGSPAARGLRAAVWESVFTHDLARYRRALYQRMGDITTLISGPSGTGKELVARAVGLSRYIPFDAKSQTFSQDPAESFHALSLSALSPTLIESELFGHRRGSFTGAIDDRAGWLEVCRPLGTVFLDEIGEIDPAVQVKLLRVLQTRTFVRLGDTRPQQFLGKIIAATNRDLGDEMRAGGFRQDFYYRLCADMVRTPSLREMLDGSAGELHELVLFIAARVAGDEAPALASEVERWIERELGADYPWPGNFRELEQCVRNVLVRGAYRPPRRESSQTLAEQMQRGALTAEQLLRRYCTMLYQRTGSYEETARRLAIDRRTVKAKVEVDPAPSAVNATASCS
jgi:transcriptional regulator of acetoin/glycerol metabolism